MKFVIVGILIGLVCTECQAVSLRGHYDTSRLYELDDRLIPNLDDIHDAAFETAFAIGTNFLGKFSPEAREEQFGSASPPPVDLLFVIDKSGSIGESDFVIVRDHIKELIDLFQGPIGPSQTRVSAISFSSAHQVDLDFNFLACDSKVTCSSLVGQIDFEGGATHTTKALDKANEEAFTAKQGSRPNAHKVLFLVTDGHSNGGGNVVGAANALKDTGVEIYGLGVTDNINEDELRNILSDPVPDHLFYFENFSAMSSGTDYLSAIFGMAPGPGRDDDLDDGRFFGIGFSDPREPVLERLPARHLPMPVLPQRQYI